MFFDTIIKTILIRKITCLNLYFLDVNPLMLFGYPMITLMTFHFEFLFGFLREITIIFEGEKLTAHNNNKIDNFFLRLEKSLNLYERSSISII